MNNNLYPNIYKRKSFHIFHNVADEKFTEKELKQIEELYQTLTPLHPEIKTTIRIVPISQTNCYAHSEYVILFYSEEKDGYLQNIGYLGEQLDLSLVDQNIGTLWFGLGKDQPDFDDLKYVIMMAINKVSDPKAFRKDMFKAKRKALEEIWEGELIEGVSDIARFAPSAVNSQPWFIQNKNNTLMVHRYTRSLALGLHKSVKTLYYNQIDIGIFLCFLELCLSHKQLSYERTLYSDNEAVGERVLNASYKVR